MAAIDATQVAKKYITNLASTTLSSTLKKINSKTIQKKESAEELSTEKAPNGSYYSVNDIKYLTDLGYTKEKALEELSKSDKYKSTETKQGQAQQQATETAQDNNLKIRQLSKEMVAKKIDELLDDSIKKISDGISSSNLNSELTSKIQAAIQSYAGIYITNTSAISEAVTNVETELSDYLTEQASKLNTSSLSSCTNIQGVNEKAGELLKNKINTEELKSTLISSLSTSLQNCTALDGLFKNLNVSVNTSDIVKNLKLDNIDFTKTLTPILSSISTSLDTVFKNANIESVIQENITNNYKVTQTITLEEETYKQYQSKLESLYSSYSEQAASYAQTVTDQLKTAISSKLSISL